MKKLLFTGLLVVVSSVCYGQLDRKFMALLDYVYAEKADSAYMVDTTGFKPMDVIALHINNNITTKYLDARNKPFLRRKRIERACIKICKVPISNFRESFHWLLLCGLGNNYHPVPQVIDSVSYKQVDNGFLFIGDFSDRGTGSWRHVLRYPGGTNRCIDTWFVGFDRHIAFVRQDTIWSPGAYINKIRIDSIAYSLRNPARFRDTLKITATDSIVYPVYPEGLDAFITFLETQLNEQASNKCVLHSTKASMNLWVDEHGAGVCLIETAESLNSWIITHGWIPGSVNGKIVPTAVTFTATLDQQENPEYDSFDTDSWRKYLHRE